MVACGCNLPPQLNMLQCHQIQTDHQPAFESLRYDISADWNGSVWHQANKA